MIKTLGDRLLHIQRQKRSAVCVGIDPRFESLPPEFSSAQNGSSPELKALAFSKFSESIISQVAPYAIAIKPQLAFFESLGTPGWQAFEDICRLGREAGLLVIADAKRGDIGTTAEAYADAFLLPKNNGKPLADACTINAYLGTDGIQPFINRGQEVGGGAFVIVKTSNPSSIQIQDLKTTDGRTVADVMADLVETCNMGSSNPPCDGQYGTLGAVVGATFPRELGALRQRLPRTFLLIPGYGAQGGRPCDVVHGFDKNGEGAIVSASRSITFPWGSTQSCPHNWMEVIAAAVKTMRDEIQLALSERKTTPGRR